VLMDIKLKGDMDGIDAAQRVRDEFNIPVVYLTAYSDENTLQRAKVTEPAGYLLKPFKDRELYATIEMALYKHKMEMELKKSAQRFATIILSIGDAVIATDLQGRVTFMNPVAETLTGWNSQDAIGRDISDVFNIVNEDTREAIGSGISGPTLWPHPWSTPDQSPHNPVRATLVAGAARSPHRLQPPESGNPLENRRPNLVPLFSSKPPNCCMVPQRLLLAMGLPADPNYERAHCSGAL